MNSSALATYDARITIGAGNVGAPLDWGNSTTTNSLSFLPRKNWDEAQIFTKVGPSLGVFSWAAGGGATNINTYAAGYDRLINTVSAASVAANLLDLKRVSGDLRLTGWKCRDTTKATVHVMSMANGGWTSPDFANNPIWPPGNVWSPVNHIEDAKADLGIIMLTASDMLTGVSPRLMRQYNEETIIPAIRKTGDVAVVWSPEINPFPSDGVPRWKQVAMKRVARDMAEQNSCLWIDLEETDFATADADGLMANSNSTVVGPSFTDPVHWSAAGSGKWASDITRAVMQ